MLHPAVDLYDARLARPQRQAEANVAICDDEGDGLGDGDVGKHGCGRVGQAQRCALDGDNAGAGDVAAIVDGEVEPSVSHLLRRRRRIPKTLDPHILLLRLGVGERLPTRGPVVSHQFRRVADDLIRGRIPALAVGAVAGIDTVEQGQLTDGVGLAGGHARGLDGEKIRTLSGERTAVVQNLRFEVLAFTVGVQLSFAAKTVDIGDEVVAVSQGPEVDGDIALPPPIFIEIEAQVSQEFRLGEAGVDCGLVGVGRVAQGPIAGGQCFGPQIESGITHKVVNLHAIELGGDGLGGLEGATDAVVHQEGGQPLLDIGIDVPSPGRFPMFGIPGENSHLL